MDVANYVIYIDPVLEVAIAIAVVSAKLIRYVASHLFPQFYIPRNLPESDPTNYPLPF